MRPYSARVAPARCRVRSSMGIGRLLGTGVALALLAHADAQIALDVKGSGERTFYLDGRTGRNQITIFSRATLEDFTMVCNRISGECRLDSRNVESFRGRFVVRVDDLRTGIALRDEHLHGEEWLDAARYPDIVIEITKVKDARRTAPNAATATLLGTFSMHGRTQPVVIPATLAYLDESSETLKRAKGDLVRLRGEFQIKLSDFGVTGPPMSDFLGPRVANNLVIQFTVFGSTKKPPEATADESWDTRPVTAPAPKEDK
jgi:polyisoprenoid-binding protein YceI